MSALITFPCGKLTLNKYLIVIGLLVLQFLFIHLLKISLVMQVGLIRHDKEVVS
jgi:hypothetical protein